MAEFNSYLLGKARKSVGNLTIVYAKGKNIVRAKVFGRKDNPTPEVLMQRMRVRLLGRFARRILPVVYVILMSDEIIKIPITYKRYRSYKWLNDVTR